MANKHTSKTKTPAAPSKKTVSFELPAETYEAYAHAIRVWFDGMPYSEDGTLRKIDIAVRARMLLERDTEDLLKRVASTRLNPDVAPAARNVADEPIPSRKVVPFMPFLAKSGRNIPGIA